MCTQAGNESIDIISHLWKRNIIFPTTFGRDFSFVMLMLSSIETTAIQIDGVWAD